MTSRTRDAFRAAWSDLADACDHLGLTYQASSDPSEPGRIADQKIYVEPLSVPTVAKAEQLVRRPATDGIALVVADRVSASVRDVLRSHGWGWLDRRGHLRIFQPDQALYIDSAVPAAPVAATRARRTDPLSTGVGLEVAVALLLEPERKPSVRALARSIGRSPSAVSVALRELRDAALVTRAHTPLLPELFIEVSRAWSPRRIAVQSLPAPQDFEDPRLRTRIGDLDQPGWALTGSVAAADWGAPIVLASDFPPDLYASDERAARRATLQLGRAASWEARAATLSVAPISQVPLLRFPPRGGTLGMAWPLAHPLFVALELARDQSRGAEILDQWDPPEGFHRVW